MNWSIMCASAGLCSAGLANDDIDEWKEGTARGARSQLNYRQCVWLIAGCFASNCEIFALAFRSCQLILFLLLLLLLVFSFHASNEANRFFCLRYLFIEKILGCPKTNTMGTQVIIGVVAGSEHTANNTHTHTHKLPEIVLSGRFSVSSLFISFACMLAAAVDRARAGENDRHDHLE